LSNKHIKKKSAFVSPLRGLITVPRGELCNNPINQQIINNTMWNLFFFSCSDIRYGLQAMGSCVANFMSNFAASVLPIVAMKVDIRSVNSTRGSSHLTLSSCVMSSVITKHYVFILWCRFLKA
jgi:hypothetical protein